MNFSGKYLLYQFLSPFHCDIQLNTTHRSCRRTWTHSCLVMSVSCQHSLPVQKHQTATMRRKKRRCKEWIGLTSQSNFEWLEQLGPDRCCRALISVTSVTQPESGIHFRFSVGVFTLELDSFRVEFGCPSCWPQGFGGAAFGVGGSQDPRLFYVCAISSFVHTARLYLSLRDVYQQNLSLKRCCSLQCHH